MPDNKKKNQEQKQKQKQTERRRVKRQKANQRLSQNAERDVMLSINPAERRLQDWYDEMLNGALNAYGGAADRLGKIDAIPYEQLGEWLNSQAGELAGLLGTATPAGEAEAAANLQGSIFGGGNSLLANSEMRNREWQQSSQREANLSQRYAEDELLQRMEDAMSDLYADVPSQILARKDELRRQRTEQQLARSQMASDQAFNEFLQSQLGGMFGGGNGNGNGDNFDFGPGTNSGGVNTNGGTVSHATIDNQGMGNGILQRINAINSIDNFGGLPPWLQEFWRTGMDMSDLNKRRRRIVGGTKQHVRGMFPRPPRGGQHRGGNGGIGRPGPGNPYPDNT